MEFLKRLSTASPVTTGALWGGVLGFILFLWFMLWGPLVATAEYSGKALEALSVLFTTLIGAWAGAAAAFYSERKAREGKETASRISAANKAVFAIAQMYMVLENLREFYIDKDNARRDPNRALKMDSPQPGMVKEIGFNFDELSFFLDQPGNSSAQILMELMLLEWKYQIVHQTVELRANAIGELRREMQARPLANINQIGVDGIRQFYNAPYMRVESLTDQFSTVVDDGIKTTRETNANLQKSLEGLFTGQGFLQINFQGAAMSGVNRNVWFRSK